MFYILNYKLIGFTYIIIAIINYKVTLKEIFMKYNMSMIAAISRNNYIGIANRLPWHIEEDLQYFKQVTIGHTIIMGRKTFESIGRPLPSRRNIVLTRDEDFSIPGVETIHSFEDALQIAHLDPAETFIIGGGEIYHLFIPYADKLYLTLVDMDIKGDTLFPSYDNHFTQINCEPGISSSNTGFNYYFTEWVKK